MGVQEGTGFHVKPSAGVKSIVPHYDVAHRAKVEIVVKGLLLLIREERVLNDEPGLDIRHVVCHAVPSKVIPNTILIICEVDMNVIEMSIERIIDLD